VVVQADSLFRVDEESQFVRYVVDEEVDEQGVKVRCRFTDNV